jgi:RNase H-fold protein (predicted Holliday junction resolvase)
MLSRSQLIKILLFITPLIVTYAWVESSLATLPTSYALKASLLKKNPKIQIITLGDSHGYYGIDPSVWPIQGINLANNSQSLWYDLQITKKAVNNFPNLQEIVLPISYFSLWYEFSELHDEYWRQYFYMRIMHIPPSTMKAVVQVQNYSLFALYSPQIAIHVMRTHSLPPSFDNAYLMPYGTYAHASHPEQQTPLEGMTKIRYQSSLIEQSLLEKNLTYIDDIISLCKTHSIKLILVTLPTHSYYYSQEQQSIRNTITTEIQKRTDNITVFNSLNDRDTSYTTPDFFDTDHLSGVGAKKFSKKLYEEVISRLISSK